MPPVSHALFAAALLGLALATGQAVAVLRHRRPRPVQLRATPGVSILKPLCGHDDDLATHLELFATGLDSPDDELLLGVRSSRDGAFPVAREAARRWPGRVRVLLQRGEPGLNPKVNQLLTLAAAARHDLFVISDSNVQVGPGYLREIVAHLASPDVGLVTNPTVGVGENSLGALLDNLHMTAGIGAGMIAAKLLAGEALVVGKSMALRRADVEALGGFAAVKDVLAEDFVLGRLVPRLLGKRVVMASCPVFNVTRERTVVAFVQRFERWSVMQRQAVGTPVYLAQLLLQPTALALAGFLVSPGASTALAWASCAAWKSACDALAVARLRPGRFPAAALAAAPLKDLLVAFAWAQGLVNDTVTWRGHRLRVLAGTRLERPESLPEPAAEAPPLGRAA